MENLFYLSNACKEFFNSKANAISTETGFIKRKRKLTGSAFLKAMLLSHLDDPTCSINAICQWLSEDSISITKQGLDYRFNNDSVRFMKSMYLESLNLFKTSLNLECEILQQFRAVKLLDSSYISLPNNMEGLYRGCRASFKNRSCNTKSAVKLQLLFNYLNQTIENIELTEGIRADAGYRNHLNNISANDLLIADLGYFVPSSFKYIDEIYAYFISRYKSDTNLYDVETNEKIDLLNILQDKLYFENDIILGKNSQLKVRIICEKLTPEQAASRRRKANKLAKSHGYKSSAKNQRLLDWSIFITNIPRDKVNGKQILKIYRARWQIELLFKLYKSHFEIDNYASNKPERVLCELYAKLCSILIFHGIVSCAKLKENAEISLTKAYLYLKRISIEFFVVLGQTIKKIKNFISKLVQNWSIFALKDRHSKRKISTLGSLKILALNPLT